MTNRNSTKRALLSSVMALVLCFSMLLGTTFAWFTDSVTSAGNIIKSGDLEVGMYWADGTKDVPALDTANNEGWTNAESGAMFTADQIWEPGYVDVKHIMIKNEGTLALKYALSIVANGTVSILSDVIDVYFVDPAVKVEGRTALTENNKLGTLTQVLAGLENGTFGTGTLLAGKAVAVTLALKMQESANNDYENKSIGTDFSVKLVATQMTYEGDSFGPDYDKDAIFADKSYTVEGNSTLKGVLDEINAATDKNVLIQLGEGVSWETGAGHGSTPWVDEDAEVENLIIDAMGATITATGAGVGPIRMANGGTLTIKNAKIVDESVSYAEGSWEFGYLEFAGNLVFENVEFVNSISIDGENATFVNCKFNSNKDSEYAVWVSNGNASFSNCVFSGPRGLKTHEAYGSEVDTIIVDSCVFDNLTKKPGMAIGTVNADTTVIIKNSDFINCQAGDQNKYIYESDTDVTTFNFDCSENNEIIKSVTPDLVITTKEELFAFANSVNVDGTSYAGKLVVLGADIDLNNEEWTPVGQTGGNGAATYFQGMFDGKGYTIKNLKITDNAYDEGGNYAAGFFGFVDAGDAQIINVNFDTAEVNGHHWTGVVAGYISGKITGCTVKNATVNCTHVNDDACGDKAGVIVGYVNSGVVTGNTVQESTVTAGRDAGQVVGCAKTTQAYDNTIINVTVTAAGDCTGANIRNEEIGRLN